MGFKPRAEHRNYILLTHPRRAPRKLQFERQGQKGLYMRGGVWGQDDWFVTLHPQAEEALQFLKTRFANYIKRGFTVERSRIYVPRFAEVLGLPPSKKKRRALPPAANKTLEAAIELLRRPKPVSKEGFRSDIKDMKNIYAQTGLTREVRGKLSERLSLRAQQLADLAKNT